MTSLKNPRFKQKYIYHHMPFLSLCLVLCNTRGWKMSRRAGDEVRAWHLFSDVFKTQGSVIVSINHYYRFIFLSPLAVLLGKTQAGHCHPAELKWKKRLHFGELPKMMAGSRHLCGCTNPEPGGEEGQGHLSCWYSECMLVCRTAPVLVALSWKCEPWKNSLLCHITNYIIGF